MDGNWYGPAFPRPGNYPAGMGEMAVDDMRDAADTVNRPQEGMSLRLYVMLRIVGPVLQGCNSGPNQFLPMAEILRKVAHMADQIIEASKHTPHVNYATKPPGETDE